MSASPNDDSGTARPKPSFGNMGPEHWSKARAGTNEEALAYYRERSKAPGVAAGGAERNHYCMRCDGVIPFDPELTACPHCHAPLEGDVKRYFNWVEINEPPKSDARPLLAIAVGVVLLLLAAAFLVWWVSR
jgi:hypothetical protein